MVDRASNLAGKMMVRTSTVACVDGAHLAQITI